MNIIKNFAERHNGQYEEVNIKNVYSQIGRMIYQPKKAKFLIDGSKISINIDEVGGSIPTAEPFRITLHLSKNSEDSLDIYPSTFFEMMFQKILQTKNKKLKYSYVFRGNGKTVEKLLKKKSFIEQLQKHKVYIRIPKANTSSIILTPPHGIESDVQLESFIEILKCIEKQINTADVSRNY